jgi:predicted metal-dependent hydrolase
MKRQNKRASSDETPGGPLQLDLFASPEQSAPPSPPAAPAGATRRILMSGQVIDYALKRSKRRSIGFMIGDDGLRISAPRWITIAEIELAIREKQRWILSKLHERRESALLRSQAGTRWGDGRSLPYMGDDIVLRLDALAPVPVAFDAALGELRLALPFDADEQQLKDQIRLWLQQQAHDLFAQRLPLYAQQLGVDYHSFALSSATTQWGSCTSAGRIRLNWRLVHFSLPLIDYVIAHELAHLREMNHSARFWAIVESVIPDFENARKTLQKRSREIMPMF